MKTSDPSAETKKFSTFEGVFTPTILTIIGVVIFLRANFVVGHAGIIQALVILTIAKTIITLTGLSISAIATNTEVKAGGAYYLISRSIGPEFGGAIALTIFMSQSVAIPFYLIGFSEALILTFPALDPYYDIIAYGAFAFVAFFSLKGAGIVAKTQFVVMAILGVSIASFIIGAALKFDAGTFMANLTPYDAAVKSGAVEAVTDGNGNLVDMFPFWTLFAIYFTAVIGILAGVNMSGNLRNPTRSIPRGTLLAIFAGFLIYASQIVLCGGSISRGDLMLKPYDSLTGLWPFVTPILIVLGVLAATLSSALGTILGAPRVLQSLAQDKLLKPVNIFAKTTADGEPRRALILTLAIGFTVIHLACRGGSGGGGLNAVAGIVSMFFLLTYGIINLAAFMESFSRNPSFRPRFKFFHWFTALVGTVASFGVTLLINPGAAILAGIIFTGIFFYVRKYVMSASFGDARRGFFYSRTRDNLLTLSTLPIHAKNWRPTVAAFVGDPEERLHLVKYADWLSSGRGILTIAAMLKGNFAEMVGMRAETIASLNDVLNKNRIKAFPEVLVTPDFNIGISHFLQSHSIGPVKPNLAIFGWSSDPARAQSFMSSIRTAASLNMSIGLICGKELPDAKKERGKRRVIDVWWRGLRNGSLMVILAYLLSLNPEWSGAKIRILRMVKPGEADAAREELEHLIEAARVDAHIEIITSDNFPNMLRQYSGLSSVVFLGFSADMFPDPQKFQELHGSLLVGMPTTILIQSTGEADLLS